ncbi:MAG: prolipoprotein diacylglyceryl transferase [Myxococcales bacterium]|nr:prolipoprotein diacylglyceryl transferase [Myxococcales bacterium]
MNPLLLDFTLPLLGRVEFPAYMTLLLVGFALAIWLSRRGEDRAGKDGDRIVDLGLLMLACGMLGSRLLSVLADGKLDDFINLCLEPTLVEAPDRWVDRCVPGGLCGWDYLCNPENGRCYPPRDCLAPLKFWEGGLAYYGGFLLAAPVGFWYARRQKLGVWRVSDLTAPGIALGLFFGRIGCFLNGCCHGAQCDLPWAVTFPQRSIPHNVHPAQLYEALGSLALFVLLYFVVRPRKRRHGEVFAWLLVGYGVLRFVLEFVRADPRGSLFGLSTSQWIGIPLITAGFVLLRWLRRPPVAA